MAEDGITVGADGAARCAWAGADALYGRYHDTEWGRPQGDSRALYEKLCLEGFQAGLSWITILRKREAFRELFEGFEVDRVARFGEPDIERIVQDARIIRHRGKIASAIRNARAVRELEQKEGRSLAAFLWSFEPGEDERPRRVTRDWIVANTVTPASTRLSKALKKHGFGFVGPTTCHAFMEAMGMVNDHMDGCACRAPCEAERQAFVRPR
ncbi:DNA-3-methyladenine glycosylase I [Aureimonas mangrovi]|uniref:DNA-3-methyladenine glycosylase I n=1 Tax=Aureimonas mangrovi TaxID=2758041 RepID=UPI00163DDE57|nr:DNA-3-methyladenine glycosylase I [Aureimonas mangrovi]